jgi:hypothetical protein
MPWSRNDRAFALAAILLTAVPVAVRLLGGGWFDPYPTVAADDGAAVICGACALTAIALAPFAISLRRRARRRAYPGPARA